MTSMTGGGGYGQVTGPNGKVGNKIPKGYRQGQTQNYTPEQMELYKQQFSHLGPDSYLSKLAGGDQSFFDEIEAPAHRQFNAAQGQTASRFSGMGMGGRKSSGFQNEMTAASSNFAEQLQSNRQGLQRQAIQDLMGMSNTLLGQRPYENFLYEKPQKQGGGWGGAIGAGVGGLGGFLIGGPGGAMAGAQLGYGVGNSFGGGGGQSGGFGAGVDLSPFKNQDFAYNFANHFSPGI